MAKLFATEAAQQVIDAAVQIFGGLGVVRGVTVVAALSRNPGTTHLRRRKRGAEADHCFLRCLRRQRWEYSLASLRACLVTERTCIELKIRLDEIISWN